MYNFYKAEYNPNNLTGQVGGSSTTINLSGYLGELFPRVDAPPTESDRVYTQYRKIFIKNEYDSTSNNTRLWLDAEQHRGQIAIAVQTGVSYSITSGSVEPTGISSWANPQNYANGLEIGTLTANSITGVWVRQTLTSITEPDPFVSLRLHIGGILE